MTDSFARYMNTAALTLMAAIVAGYESGLLAASNAFFGAVVLGVVVLCAQLLNYEGETIGAAARKLASGPAEQSGTASYVSFLGVMALGTALSVQVIAGF